jgi:hypothetical protein
MGTVLTLAATRRIMLESGRRTLSMGREVCCCLVARGMKEIGITGRGMDMG